MAPHPWDPTLANLGVTDAPLTRAGLATALRFFSVHMPTLSERDRFDFLKGIDLHSPVREATLQAPQEVAAFRKAGENPIKLFYTKAGTSLHALGVNPATRGFRRMRVVRAVTALESRCSGVRDTWTNAGPAYIAGGGGLQYIIPSAQTALQVIQ